MDRLVYEEKLKALISDPDKFVKTDSKQSERVKVQVNKVAAKYKDCPEMYKKLKIKGNYQAGHLYGLPKLHKDPDDPPLRPIVSMTGTVTHELAQYLNQLIYQYLDQKHMVRSGNEFILALDDAKVSPTQAVVSLDVESLFTNVPVHSTIDIILNRAYNHESLPPPPLAQEDLRELLQICTQLTPFCASGEFYLQSDGCSMGSPLGSTLANFYMADLESKVLNSKAASNPSRYYRYMDDIFAIFEKKTHVRYFISRLKNRSVLNFTYESMENNIFNFLDVRLFLKPDGKFETSVFIKATDSGVYANFHSHIPDQYKRSVVNSLVNRAIKYSSNASCLNNEFNRIRQILANNSYPQSLVDSIIHRKMHELNSQANMDVQQNDNKIKFFVQLFNLSGFKSDRRRLKNIVLDHVKPVLPDSSISLLTYFKPNKLSAQFSTRSRAENIDRVNVVYKFDCYVDGCNSSYIGYTTQTLKNRIAQHRYNSSSIWKHMHYDHSVEIPNFDDFAQCFNIVFSSSSVISLKIVEAILIKSDKPPINVKFNELYDFLQLY